MKSHYRALYRRKHLIIELNIAVDHDDLQFVLKTFQPLFPLSPDKTLLGYCDSIEEIMIGESKVIRFSGCKQNEACTIVLRGANLHILGTHVDMLHASVTTHVVSQCGSFPHIFRAPALYVAS